MVLWGYESLAFAYDENLLGNKQNFVIQWKDFVAQ